MIGQWKFWLVVVVVAASLPGLARLRFDTDVTGILPADLPEVRGLQLMQREFSRDGELVVLLEAADEDAAWLLPELTTGLATHLIEDGRIRTVRWMETWDHPDAERSAAEWIAWLWLNGDPAEVRAWQRRFDEENLAPAFAAALAAVATAPEGAEMIMRANDPFGFLRHPAVRFLESAGGGDGFASEDGMARLLLIEHRGNLASYRDAGAWVDALRGTVEDWLRENADGARVAAHFTGEPAFAADIGRAMERDMRGTAWITIGLVSLLFWWMQRRLRLLAGLVAMLALVFTTTLGVAGWVLGELSVMTAGFAAILIGLAVDYGVLICQEAKRVLGDAAALRRATSGSILWAAATTAAVFAALNFSALPGIAALGTLVSIGILCGAAVMLAFYLPFVAKAGGHRPVATTHTWLAPCSSWKSLLAGAALVVAVAAVLVWRGPPQSGFDPAMMRPRDSAAMDAFLRVQAGFPAAREPDARWVVEIAPGESATDRLDALAQTASANRFVRAAIIPHGWWPDADRQQINRAALADAAQRADGMLTAAGDAGFSPDGLALGREVLAAFGRLAEAPGMVDAPASAAFEMLTASFMSRRADGGGVLAIDLELNGPVGTQANQGVPLAELRGLNDATAFVTGWVLLRPALMPLVADDVRRVFLPMLGVMLVMLCVVFRNWREVAAIAAAMSLAGGMLLAAMVCFGISWNVLNIAAAPLFLGIGIDYGIHMGMALRRHAGDSMAAWHGTGKAVVFCAASTGIGFGSLCFASNDALASFGAVSVLGIACAMFTSVFLLPGWRGSLGKHGGAPIEK